MFLLYICRFPGSPPKIKPVAVDHYNKYMLGVDRLDQRMSYYCEEECSLVAQSIFSIVEVAVVNAYILYTAHTDVPRKLSHKEFRRELVLALCDEQRSTTTHHR